MIKSIIPYRLQINQELSVIFIKCQKCDRPGKYKHNDGMICKRHYDKLRKRGSLDLPDNFNNTMCMADGCANKASRKGLCGKHYARLRKHGDANHIPISEVYKVSHCSFLGCGSKIKSKGLCGKHYRRLLLNGDPKTIKKQWSSYIKDVNCVICGSHIDRKYHSRVVCSDRCYHRYRNGQSDKSVCSVCGSTFLSINGKLTCSDICGEEYEKLRIRTWIENQQCNNPEYQKRRTEAQRRRHAVKKGVTVEKFKDSVIHDRDNWRCKLCGYKINKKKRYPDPMSASIDHIIPISKGGRHISKNVQSAHLLCNMRKSNNAKKGGEQLLLFG